MSEYQDYYGQAWPLPGECWRCGQHGHWIADCPGVPHEWGARSEHYPAWAEWARRLLRESLERAGLPYVPASKLERVFDLRAIAAKQVAECRAERDAVTLRE